MQSGSPSLHAPTHSRATAKAVWQLTFRECRFAACPVTPTSVLNVWEPQSCTYACAAGGSARASITPTVAGRTTLMRRRSAGRFAAATRLVLECDRALEAFRVLVAGHVVVAVAR